MHAGVTMSAPGGRVWSCVRVRVCARAACLCVRRRCWSGVVVTLVGVRLHPIKTHAQARWPHLSLVPSHTTYTAASFCAGAHCVARAQVTRVIQTDSRLCRPLHTRTSGRARSRLPQSRRLHAGPCCACTSWSSPGPVGGRSTSGGMPQWRRQLHPSRPMKSRRRWQPMRHCPLWPASWLPSRPASTSPPRHGVRLPCPRSPAQPECLRVFHSKRDGTAVMRTDCLVMSSTPDSCAH